MTDAQKTTTALSPALTKHRAGAAVWLRLQRPAAMNAISTDLLDELNLALDEIESDDSVRVVVLTGTGRAFCAGADLKALGNAAGEIDPSRVVEFVSYAGRTIERLAALAQPVIAGVNGLALAGGLELLLADWSPDQHADLARMLDRLSRALVGDEADPRLVARGR